MCMARKTIYLFFSLSLQEDLDNYVSHAWFNLFYLISIRINIFSDGDRKEDEKTMKSSTLKIATIYFWFFFADLYSS